MTDEVSLLRQELAALRVEMTALRRDHERLLSKVGLEQPEPGEPAPEYLHIEASCLAVRNDPMKIPIIMRADGHRASIAFIDENHRHRAELSIDEDGARFEMHNADGKLIFQLAEGKDGSGQMCVCDPAGRPRAGMRVNDVGGVVNVLDPQGQPQAFLLGQPAGGEVFAVNAMHKAAATLRATARGGVVGVHEPSGQLMGFLAADTDGGVAGVHGPHGALAAQLGSAQEGGLVTFFDLEGEPREQLP